MAAHAVGSFFGYAFVIFIVSTYLQAYGLVDNSGRLTSAESLASFGGAALGRIVLSLSIPGGAAPNYGGFLIAGTVVCAVAPVLFVVSWWGLRRTRMVEDRASSTVGLGESAEAAVVVTAARQGRRRLPPVTRGPARP